MKAINRAGNLKRICNHERRRTRRIEAISRNLAWSALSTATKLASLDQRGMVARKQRAKLAKQIDK